MRSSRFGALIGTFSLAFLLLAALIFSTFFISRTHDRNTNVPTGATPKKVFEFVRPLKMRPPLHERDVLYPEEESRPQGTNHHSGHFRERMAEIWDPHPEYEFTGFGRRFHLQLAQSQAPFVAKGIKVMHVWENLTVAGEPNLRPEGCFYTGRVKGDPNSQVSVNLCHGMTGHIRTLNENYLIEPVEPWTDLKTPIKHSLQKLPNSQFPMGFDFSNEASSRKKRSLSKEYYVELMVVVDTEMSRYHGPSLDSYVLNLISIAAMIFKDASIGNHINIAVVKLFKIEDNDIFKKSANEKGSSASTMLRNFCEWQSTHNSPDDSSARHHDSALLLTRKNICWDHLHQPDRCDTLGLAELGTMCESSSCALVRDIGLSAGFTIAHEIGHVLNMPHDDNYKCLTYNEKEDKSYVMSRMLDNNTYPWAWSNCSRHFLTEFLDAGSGDCLLDPPYEDKLPDRFEVGGQYPGEVFNEDKQCELLFGKRSKICYSKPVCKTLWCTLETGNQSHPCKSYNLPWADGTPCGEKEWCQRGHCVKRNRESLYPIDGGWGAWQPYGDCSRSCGGGIKKSARYCNNPPPANGGHYCVGQRMRYQSCSTQECPNGSTDFREEQCAKFNRNNFKIQGLAEDVKWLPKYGGISPEDRCKLYCRVAKSSAYYLLKEKVIDGTVCGPDTYDVCVNGACLAAGCDHELNSTTDLDYCGQCGGNNSTCEQKAGSYNKPKYGYTSVVRIPSGSSNIEIRQYSHNNGHDDNYLALKDVDTDQYILNGNYVVSSHHKRIIYGGTTIEYSGSEAVIEKINASRPLTKDLVVEVLSVGNVLPPNIEYVYTVQKSTNKYTWELADDWTRCDKVCNGVSWRDYRCVKVKRGLEVAQELCDHINRPARIHTECNTNCDLEWEVASRSECTSHCGPGNRTLTFKCVKISTESGNRRTKQHDSVCSHLQKPNDTEKCEGPCYRVGWHYGSWSPCSESCGPGRRTREARCVDEKSRVIDDRNCVETKKTEETCEIKPCPKWEATEWSECSQTCGRGRKQRSISCKVGREDVDSSLCGSPPPVYFEECNLKPCPEWREAGESSCSASCGQGVRTILFECSIPNGCSNLPKPGTTRSCNLGPCSLHHENYVPDDPDSRFSWVPSPSKCSVTCGRGYKKISYHCYDNHYKKYLDNSHCPKFRSTYEIEECFLPCGVWVAKEWEPCSAVCGEGIETRAVLCVGDNKIISDDYCLSYDKPQVERICKQSCSVEREEQWRVGNWSECSVSCGRGIQYRNVYCPIGYTCASMKPNGEQACHQRSCVEEGRWVSKGWLRCNVTCGQGYQNHSYACESSNGEPLPVAACRKSKPHHVKTCSLPRCSEDDTKPKWKTSKWSPCSLDSCTKRRTVVCMSGKHHQNDSVCLKKLKRKKPNEIRACKRPSCQKHQFGWRTGKWSECSVQCGYGQKTRQVYCPRRWQQGRQHCPGPKPHSVADCYQDCSYPRPDYKWEAGPWKPCSNHCSLNGQRRILKCLRGTVKVAKDHCRNLKKPSRWKKCDVLKCPSCQALFDVLSIEMSDGRFTIYPRLEAPLEVYCHGVGNRRPREYVSVNSRRNFAMNYSPQIRILQDCHSRCSLQPYALNNYQDGYTLFSKIAINVSTMSVITDDFEFSQTMRGRPVHYGEAGGCFSPTCNQGHFMIDFEGTGLRISRETSWTKSPNGVMDITRADDHTWVEAFCGGCCGRCWPKHGLKLDLAPP